MTCIIGLIDNGTMYVGGDSAGIYGDYITIRKDKKVFIKQNKFIYGFTASFRMGQILKYRFMEPDTTDFLDEDDNYIHTVFIDSIRKCFKEYGFNRVLEEQESGGNFLVGYNGVIYNIYEDYQIAISIKNYDVIGGGENLAKGAMFVTENINIDPILRINNALEATSYYNTGVVHPFYIEKLNYE